MTTRTRLTVSAVVAVLGLLVVGVSVVMLQTRDEPTAASGETEVVGDLEDLGLESEPQPAPGGEEAVPDVTGEPLPAATLDGFDGADEVDLSQYRGQPLLLNFWASWCAPCVDEMPDIQQVAEQANDLAVLGVNETDSPIPAAELVAELGITYDLAVDADGSYFTEVGGFGMPTTLFVDAEGRIAHRHTGFLQGDELRRLLREHLGVRI